jgi:hypothetical protein
LAKILLYLWHWPILGYKHSNCDCEKESSSMRPIALGYIVVSSENLADWASYASSQLGLQRIDHSAKTLAFRMDDRKQRVVVHEDGGSTISTYGWEMADAAAMDALAAR